MPDEHDPKLSSRQGDLSIVSPRFIKEVERVGKSWMPGFVGP